MEVKASDFMVATSREQRMAHVNVQAKKDGEIKRGTVLARTESGFASLTAENAANAEAILAEDVEAGTETVLAAVYVAGDFVEQGLIADAPLTDEARLNLKQAGIYLINGITV